MSEPEETPVTTEKKEEEPAPLVEEAKLEEIIQPETEEIDPDAEVSVHATMEKAIDNYRKIKEGKQELTDKQLEDLEKAEEAMLRADLGTAEDILNGMLSEEPDCIPALNNLAHLMGRHFSDFSKAVELYNRVIELEPDNSWARDARRRYQRYIGRD